MVLYFILLASFMNSVYHTFSYQCICNEDIVYTPKIYAEPDTKTINIGDVRQGDCFFYNGTENENNKTFWKTNIKDKAGWIWYRGNNKLHIKNCSNPIRDIEGGANCLYLMSSISLHSHPDLSVNHYVMKMGPCRDRNLGECPRLISNKVLHINNNSWFHVTFDDEMTGGYVLSEKPIRWHCKENVVPYEFGLRAWEIVLIAISVPIVLLAPFLVWIINKRRKSKLKRNTTAHHEYFNGKQFKIEYDVFVSYSREDWEWVRKVLFEKLRDEGYNICIDFKDFIPGVDVSENIFNGIYSSRKTIIVMSQNFLKSMWGQFELMQAHYRAIAQRKDTLILIRFGKCKVPRRLLGKTFLNWVCKKEKTYFWKRLFKSIGKPCQDTV